MAKTGFIIKNTSSTGDQYFYLRKSIRVKTEKGSSPRNVNLYGFGNKEKALLTLSSWKEDPALIPNELRNLGYNLGDVSKWFEDIKNK